MEADPLEWDTTQFFGWGSTSLTVSNLQTGVGPLIVTLESQVPWLEVRESGVSAPPAGATASVELGVPGAFNDDAFFDISADVSSMGHGRYTGSIKAYYGGGVKTIPVTYIYGTIFRGRVMHAVTGLPLQGATVRVVSPSGGVQTKVTGADGYAEMICYEQGAYQYTATAENFAPSGTVTGIVGPSSAEWPQVMLAPGAPDIAVDGMNEGTFRVLPVVAPGAQASEVLTIRNTGTAVLNLTGITFDGVGAEEVTLTQPPAASVPAGGTTTFTYQVAPVTFGQKRVGIHIASNVAGSKNPYDIGVKYLAAHSAYMNGDTTGQPVWQRPALSPGFPPFQLSFIFPSYHTTSFTVPQSGDYILTSGFTNRFDFPNKTWMVLYNGPFNAFSPLMNAISSSNALMSYSGTAYDNPDSYNFYSTTGVAMPLQAGVTYTLVTTGTDSADAGPYRVGIHGPAMAAIAGAGPDIAVETPMGTSLSDGSSSYLPGSVQVGASVVRTLTIRNTGTSTLSGLSISKDGAAQADYAVGALGSTSLAAGTSTTFTVTFTPFAEGIRLAALHIASNDPDENPFDFELRGEGLPTGPEITIEQPSGTGLVHGVSSTSYGTLPTGLSTVKTFTVKNTGTMELTGLSVTLSGSQASEYGLMPLGATTLPPGTSTTFSVSFTPAGTGPRTASLQVTSNDADENPFVISLIGTGAAPVTQGPDAFGYTATNGVPHTFTDIAATGTAVLDSHDDTAIAVPIGFTFSFYGTAQTTAYVSSNGLITFAAANSSYSNSNLTTANVGQPALAPMWDDWYTNKTTADKVYHSTTGSPGSRVFTVQWVVNPSGTATAASEIVFQCQMFEETGNVLFNYRDVDTGSSGSNGSSSTVGIQDTGGSSNGRFLQWSFNAASVFNNMSILFTTATGAPEIAVEQPAGTNLTDGTASIDFGAVNTGSYSSLTFTIRNSGNALLNLTGTPKVALSGADAAMFTVTTQPTTPVAGSGGITTFVIRFSPSNVGAKSASISISSNDADESSFDISLIGTGHPSQETWRQTYFGTPTNSGDAADNHDYDKDGLVNLLEWACGLNPTSGSVLPMSTVRNGTSLEFTFDRSIAALNAGAVFAVEWTDTLLSSDWSSSGVTEQILSSNGTVQQVKAFIPSAVTGQRFVRLKVTSPP